MSEIFEMVAKTFQGLEGVLSDELQALGAQDVTQGKRMVSFKGSLETMYKANFCCRTALRILKPIYKFRSTDADDLYEQVRQFEWDTVLSTDKTFSIDTTVFSDVFRHSRFVTYRVKDAIVDYFQEKEGKRPSIRVSAADFVLNVHISGDEVTISLDSSGAPLYKRGWRVAQTEAPINEVLAAGIIKLSGWDGQSNFVDPMCGSGTFLIEAAMIAANINPGVYRKEFAFQNWSDYDADLFDAIYNDDSQEREFNHKIYGCDVAVQAVAIAEANIKSAGLSKMIELQQRSIADWEEAPEKGVLITNPPYGERLKYQDINELYATLGNKLKFVFKGYDAWVISYGELTDLIGLRASVNYPLLNGDLECELREYKIFDGTYKEMKAEGGSIRNEGFRAADKDRGQRRPRFEETFKKRDGEKAEGKERRPRRAAGPRREGDQRPPRRFADRPRREGDERMSRNDYFHSTKHAQTVVRHQEPTLGKENERPIIRGRRNGWKRREE
ncbi:MAG: THUMP domain-containing protein [Bacteroidales bacterium]|nr:THUMP domain-containing protein [Bacteroidales bacterium]